MNPFLKQHYVPFETRRSVLRERAEKRAKKELRESYVRAKRETAESEEFNHRRTDRQKE